MRRTTWQSAMLIGALGGALALWTGCAATRGPVRIGLAGPFTDPVGRPMRLAAELAVEEINRGGGIDGRSIELVALDDHGDADSAVAVATKLYRSDVSAVVGHLYSGTSLSAAPIYNGGDDPVVEVSPSSSSPELSSAGAWTFRVCPSDLSHGKALAAWARNDLRLERGTVFYLNDGYGRGIRQPFVDEFTRLGGQVQAIDPYMGSTPDVGPYLDRLARDGRSQFIFVAGNKDEADAILRQAAARGIRLPLLGADGLEGIEGTDATREAIYESAAYLPTIATAANRRFVDAWRAKYPDAPLPNQPAAATYDAVRLLAEAMRESGTDRAAVRRGLMAHNPSHTFEGASGRIAFDSLGDVPDREVYIAVARDGALQLAGQQ